MFEQFTAPERPLAERTAKRLQLTGILLFSAAQILLFGFRSHVPDFFVGLVYGLSIGLQIAALPFYLSERRMAKRARRQQAGLSS